MFRLVRNVSCSDSPAPLWAFNDDSRGNRWVKTAELQSSPQSHFDLYQLKTWPCTSHFLTSFSQQELPLKENQWEGLCCSPLEVSTLRTTGIWGFIVAFLIYHNLAWTHFSYWFSGQNNSSRISWWSISQPGHILRPGLDEAIGPPPPLLSTHSPYLALFFLNQSRK